MYKTVLLVRRKPGMSREAFIAYYKSTHAPLAVKHLTHMSGYKRTFLMPANEANEGVDEWDFNVPLTEQYDAMVEFEWATKEDFDADSEAMLTESAKILASDEENFMDRASMRFFFVVDEEASDL